MNNGSRGALLSAEWLSDAVLRTDHKYCMLLALFIFTGCLGHRLTA